MTAPWTFSFFVVVGIQREHLRETCCFVECCALKLVQVSLGGMALTACLCRKKGPFSDFPSAASVNWSLGTRDFQTAVCHSGGVTCSLSRASGHLEGLRSDLGNKGRRPLVVDAVLRRGFGVVSAR